MKKRTLIAWVGKRAAERKTARWFAGRLPVWKTKGTKCEWSERDWPPVKVRITIEEAK